MVIIVAIRFEGLRDCIIELHPDNNVGGSWNCSNTTPHCIGWNGGTFTFGQPMAGTRLPRGITLRGVRPGTSSPTVVANLRGVTQPYQTSASGDGALSVVLGNKPFEWEIIGIVP